MTVCVKLRKQELAQDASPFHEKYLQEKFCRFQAVDRMTNMLDVINMVKKERERKVFYLNNELAF